jgi:hypothetical protein
MNLRDISSGKSQRSKDERARLRALGEYYRHGGKLIRVIYGISQGKFRRWNFDVVHRKIQLWKKRTPRRARRQTACTLRCTVAKAPRGRSEERRYISGSLVTLYRNKTQTIETNGTRCMRFTRGREIFSEGHVHGRTPFLLCVRKDCQP